MIVSMGYLRGVDAGVYRCKNQRERNAVMCFSIVDLGKATLVKEMSSFLRASENTGELRGPEGAR